jgi:aminopeptidase-like protein
MSGNGVRQTLSLIGQRIPLQTYEVPTGTEVFDWTVPKEWNIRDAYIKDQEGNRIVDFRKSNLHVVGYSVPVNTKMTFAELKHHLHTLPDYPDLIPYRHTYYRENWGFCLSHNQLSFFQNSEYEVYIDSSLENGHLTLAESVFRGETEKEVVIFTHTCHPSLCNDNLSGIGVATFLADWIRAYPRQYTYRFLFCPSTIGSITWLSKNEKKVQKIKHGLILTGLGDSGGFTYKKSRQGDFEIDRMVACVLNSSKKPFEIIDFSPLGYDERQFCSPGFNLPFGCLMRTPNGKYPEYHTSGDDMTFIGPENLAESLDICKDIVDLMESNKKYRNKKPKCEPQLGKRGLFATVDSKKDSYEKQLALMWVLNLSDGHHSLLDISIKSGIRFDLIKEVGIRLSDCGLLWEIGGQSED